MKERITDTRLLAENVPPPSEYFAATTMARLRAMAIEEERPMKRKISTAVLVAALLVVLLAATALAIGLRRTAEADAVVEARQALIADYGLTSETLGCFQGTATPQDGGWTVVFVAEGMEPERLGDYTVTLSPGEAPQASWTHDDVDPAIWQDGNPDAPVWGQPQIIAALQAKRAAQLADSAQAQADMTFEEAMAHSPTLTLHGGEDGQLHFERAVPRAGEIEADEAIENARYAICEAYGIVDDALADYTEETSFAVSQEAVRQYIVRYWRRGVRYDEESYAVHIDAASGEVLALRWLIAYDMRTLPDGPLDAYAHAVAEYLQSGALALASATEKADILRRIESAGHKALLADVPAYLLPDGTDIDEADAIVLAQDALARTYGMDDAALTLFSAQASLDNMPSGRCWLIRFSADTAQWPQTWIGYDFAEKIGVYSVWLAADTGELADTIWNRARDTDDAARTLGDAPVFHGALLGEVAALRDALAAIAAKYPEDAMDYDYSIEDAGAFDALFRDAGFNPEQFSRGIPQADDVQYEEALALAKAAVLAEMPDVSAALESGYIGVQYSILNPDMPRWGFSFQFDVDGVAMDFGVAIDARTGEILLTNPVTGGNG